MTEPSQQHQHHSVPNPETLRAALEDADLRALLLTVYILTGESEWLELKPRRDTRILAPEDAGLPPADQDRLRSRAFELLRGGAREPVVAAPDEPTMLKLMSLALGEAVPPEYAPMMREELGMRTAIRVVASIRRITLIPSPLPSPFPGNATSPRAIRSSLTCNAVRMNLACVSTFGSILV